MQFRLRTLIALFTLTAVACAVFFAAPLVVEIPILALLVLVSPSVWICGACFAKGRWRGFFLGGICAAWLPHAILMYHGGAMGISVIEDVDSLTELAELGEDYDLWWRLFVAGCFLFPGVVAFLGGGCGALVVHWIAVEQHSAATYQETRQMTSSRRFTAQAGGNPTVHHPEYQQAR